MFTAIIEYTLITSLSTIGRPPCNCFELFERRKTNWDNLKKLKKKIFATYVDWGYDNFKWEVMLIHSFELLSEEGVCFFCRNLGKWDNCIWLSTAIFTFILNVRIFEVSLE